MPRVSSCAARLSAALHIRGMKQIELCDRTGISKSAMSQYLKGVFEPKQSRIEAMARALDVNEAWLMGYDDVPMERGEKGGQQPGELRSSSAVYKVSGNRQRENDGFEEFLSAIADETKDLSLEGRNKLLELARFFKLQEGKLDS